MGLRRRIYKVCVADDDDDGDDDKLIMMMMTMVAALRDSCGLIQLMVDGLLTQMELMDDG